MPRARQAGDGKLPRFVTDASLNQVQHGLGPSLIDTRISTVPSRTHAHDSENLRRAFRRREVYEQGQRPMPQLIPDMSRADLAANPLNPSLKGDTRELAVTPLRNAIPDSDADILHDVVRIARASDPRQPGHHVSVHTINRNHDPVDLDGGLPHRRCSPQRDIHPNGGPRCIAGLIGLGFDFHGFTALTGQIEYVAESRKARLLGVDRESITISRSYTNYCRR